MKNIIVTGANGYLGGWLCHLLRTRGHTPLAFNSRRQPVTLTPINQFSPPLMELQLAIERADAVIHLAWYSSAGNQSESTHADCLTETAELARLVRRYGQHHAAFIFASTASVYGDIAKIGGEFYEGDKVMPNCAYTTHKERAERQLLTLLEGRVAVLRYGSMMGLGNGRTKTELVVNAFAVGAYRDREIKVWNPESWKPVIHVQDAAETAMQAAVQGWWGVYNVATDNLPARVIAQVAKEMTGASISVVPNQRGTRSCRINSGVVKRLMGPDWGKRGVRQAIYEFLEYQPTENDHNTLWSIRHSQPEALAEAPSPSRTADLPSR